MHDIYQTSESDEKTASILRNKLNAAADKVIRYWSLSLAVGLDELTVPGSVLTSRCLCI